MNGGIKDIAARLNVSPTTVHKAIHGKKGIGEKTRSEILAYMDAHGFRPNRAAAALKRRLIKFACVLMEPSGLSRFFYQDILSGIQTVIAELQVFNVETSVHFTPFSPDEQIKILEKLLIKEGDSLNGLIITPAHDEKLNDIIRRFTEKKIAVVTLNGDAGGSSRQANVSCDNTMIGRSAGELMAAFLGDCKSGKILLLGGNRYLRNHQETAQGFVSIMSELKSELDIFECYEFDDPGRLKKYIKVYLESFADMRGVYCNSIRHTLTACETIRELGFSRKLKVIGSDVHSAILPFFEDNTLNATIFQNPRQQAGRSLWNLYYLVTREEKVSEFTKTTIGIVIRSNVKSYL
ncbi:MAG: LacI family DNA-binding transcriptional regulator [Treponema sp.]|nr:LacI family DNA-binding transcriptional regulator [Treponema sp.]